MIFTTALGTGTPSQVGSGFGFLGDFARSKSDHNTREKARITFPRSQAFR